MKFNWSTFHYTTDVLETLHRLVFKHETFVLQIKQPMTLSKISLTSERVAGLNFAYQEVTITHLQRKPVDVNLGPHPLPLRPPKSFSSEGKLESVVQVQDNVVTTGVLPLTKF